MVDESKESDLPKLKKKTSVIQKQNTQAGGGAYTHFIGERFDEPSEFDKRTSEIRRELKENFEQVLAQVLYRQQSS